MRQSHHLDFHSNVALPRVNNPASAAFAELSACQRLLRAERNAHADTRQKLRNFFEVSREYIVLQALKSLAEEGAVKPTVVTDAMRALGVSADKVDPLSV